MNYKNITVNGIRIFYRECGDAEKPVMILFHDFPSASHMFRDLMPMLETKFHCIAPDYPGFGQSESPAREAFAYTFDFLAEVMEESLDVLDIQSFYMYVFDYGAPIGFRLAMKHPERILGIVSQNGNIYREGLGKNGRRERSTGAIRQRNYVNNIKAHLRKIRSSGSIPMARKKEVSLRTDIHWICIMLL